MSYLTEAFKQMELLESEQFSFDKSGAAKLESFLDEDELKDFETVIDPEAETLDDIKDSYMGKVICRCPICKSLVYKEPEAIVISEEEDLANVEEPCPYCFEAGGFEIVGQVAPYQEVTVDSEKPVDVKVDGKDVEPTKEEDKLEEDLSNMEKLKRTYPELDLDSTNDRRLNRRKRHTRDNEDLEDSQRYPIESPAPAQTGLREKCDERRTRRARRHSRDNEDIEDCQRFPVEGTKQVDLKEATTPGFTWKEVDGQIVIYENGKEKEKYPSREAAEDAGCNLDGMEELKESMEDISITTDDQVIKVKATPRADKETIQPVEEETIEEIEAPEEEEEMTDSNVEIEDVDEKSFDNLGESYLRNVYDNVESFKSTSFTSKGDKLIVEGIISFNSGKKAKTNFIFEAQEITNKGKLKFSGLNESIVKDKKIFTLMGNIKNNKLVLESLNYNYGTKDTNGKSQRLYGTVKNK